MAWLRTACRLGAAGAILSAYAGLASPATAEPGSSDRGRLGRAQADPAPTSLYTNRRYGFSICYPAEFASAGGEVAHGAGARFRTRDGEAHFVVYAHRRNDRATVAEILGGETDLFEAEGTRITYVAGGDTWLVISGLHRPRGEEERIFYHRAVRVPGSDVQNVLRIDYPAAAKSRYDAAVSLLARSIRPGHGAVGGER